MSGEGRRNYWLGRWAQALRSGRYTLAHGPFHSEAGDCVCGVLMSEMMQDGLLPPWDQMPQTITGVMVHPATRVAENAVGRSVFQDMLFRFEGWNLSADQLAAHIDSLIEQPAPVDRATIDAYPALLTEQEVAGVK